MVGGKVNNETAVHVFRFVRRDELDHVCFPHMSVASDGIATSWPEEPPRGDDVILLTKTYIASVEMSQPPLVFCPGEFMARLDIDDLQPAPSAILSSRQKKELAKSAQHYAQAPRSLGRASAYLQSLVDCDGTVMGDPPPLNFIRSRVGRAAARPAPADISSVLVDVERHAAAPPEGLALSMARPTAGLVRVVAAKPPPKPKKPKAAAKPQLKKRPAAADINDGGAVAPAASDAEAKSTAVMDALPSDVIDGGTVVSAASAGAPAAAGDPLAPNGGIVLRPGKRHKAEFSIDYASLGSLGCGKCRSALRGCAKCRIALGWVETSSNFWAPAPGVIAPG
jgi:hypothetical protein